MSYKLIKLSALLVLFIALIACIEPASTTTWSVNVHRLTDYSNFDGSPAITQTSDGKIWVVWTRMSLFGYYTPYYKNSSDSGATWSRATNLTATKDVGDNITPSIMESENGTIWFFWASNRSPPPPPIPYFYMNATPASLTIPQGGTDNSTISLTSVNNFNDTINLSTSTIQNVTSVLNPDQVYLPQNETVTSLLTVSVNSTATPGNYTLTVKGDPFNHKFFEFVYITLEITGSGGAALSDTTSSSSFDSSSSDGGGQDYEIFYKTSNDNGATWSTPLQLTEDTAYEDINPSVAQLANGTIMVAWQSTREGIPNIYYKTTQDGISWSDEKQITTYSGLDKSPSIIQAKDGRICMVWTSNRTGDYEIFSKTYDGVSWSSANRMTNSTNSDTAPSIMQTIDEMIWVFWTSTGLSSSATGDIYYMYSSDNGATWSDSIQFTTDNNEDSWSSATQTKYTKIWVVWTSNRGDQPDGNWDVYYRTSLVGDVNGDGVVDIYDLALVSKAYGSRVGDPDYNPDADLNKDGIVDIRDIALLSKNYGSS